MSYETTKDYKVTIRIQNNWMLKAMSGAGFETGVSLSRASGVSLQSIYLFLGLKAPFMNDDGTWKANIITIADTLGCAPDDLVPPQHLREALKKNKGTFEADFDEVAALVDHRDQVNPLLLIEQKETSHALSEAMRLRLAPHEQRMLLMTYGLGGEPPHTLEKAAKRLKISTERARQIQLNAIRKMAVGGRPHGIGLKKLVVSVEDNKRRRKAAEVLREAVGI